jgi:hypothetical protein
VIFDLGSIALKPAVVCTSEVTKFRTSLVWCNEFCVSHDLEQSSCAFGDVNREAISAVVLRIH